MVASMSDEPTIMPEHYKVLAQGFKGLVALIDKAFSERPVPAGCPITDVCKELGLYSSGLAKCAERLSSILNHVPGCIADKVSGPVSSAELRNTISSLKEELKNLIYLYHGIWRRPFPSGLAEGQELASASAEDIMNECRTLFLKVIDIVETSTEDIIAKYGGTSFTLSWTLSDQAGLRLKRWIDSHSVELVCDSIVSGFSGDKQTRSKQIQKRQPLNLSKVSILGGFLLVMGLFISKDAAALGASLIAVAIILGFCKFFRWLFRLCSP